MTALLNRDLAALPDAQREILILREFQDLGHAEIGKVLGIAVPAVGIVSTAPCAQERARSPPYKDVEV